MPHRAEESLTSLDLPLLGQRLGAASSHQYSVSLFLSMCICSSHPKTTDIPKLGTIFIRGLRLECLSRVPSRISYSARNTASMTSSQIKTMANEPQTPASTAKRRKLTGRAFYESLGSPKMILAPMVDQSEFVRCFILPLLLRMALTRRFRPGAYSPDPS